MMAQCVVSQTSPMVYCVAQANHPIPPLEDISYELEDSIGCLDDCLEYVKLGGEAQPGTNLNFAKFLIAKAQKLKVMTLICGTGWHESWKRSSDANYALRIKPH